MNAPLPPGIIEAPATTERRNAGASRRVRQAIAELRATKTSIAKARSWLPRCDLELELVLEVRKLWDIEKRLIAIARRLEADPLPPHPQENP